MRAVAWRGVETAAAAIARDQRRRPAMRGQRGRRAVPRAGGRASSLSTRWIRHLTDKELEFSIQYHADQGTAELRRFWGQVLEIDTDRIRLQRKSNSSQLRGRQWRCRYGVLTVRAHDTVLRQRMQAWMHLLRASWR